MSKQDFPYYRIWIENEDGDLVGLFETDNSKMDIDTVDALLATIIPFAEAHNLYVYSCSVSESIGLYDARPLWEGEQ